MIDIGYQGQLCGPFASSDNIFTMIKEKEGIPNDKNIIITHLGVQAKPETVVRINGNNDFYISKRKILEFNHARSNDCEISSIFFPYGADSTTIIDYTFK